MADLNHVPTVGRPSLFTPELADRICARLSLGETLRRICRDDDMPAESTVRNWALDRESPFFAQYAKAREIGYLSMADDLLEIADDGRNDTYEDGEGNTRTDTEVLGRSRLRVDTRKWLLSKALPKLYGDRLETTTNHRVVDEDDKPIGLSELARRMAFLLASASEAQAAPAAPPTQH